MICVLEKTSQQILASRPTAVNIRWALDRMRPVAAKAGTPAEAVEALLQEAHAIKAHNQAIAEDESYLSTIVPTRDGVMVALRVR